MIDLEKYNGEEDPNIKIKFGRHEASATLDNSGFKGWLKNMFAQSLVKSLIVVCVAVGLSFAGFTQFKKLSLAYAEFSTGNFDTGLSLFFSSLSKEKKYITTGIHPKFALLDKADEGEQLRTNYKKNTKFKNVFFYVGNSVAVMRRPVQIGGELAVGANGEQAQKYCAELGGRIASYKELHKLDKSKNPLVLKRFSKQRNFAELTSTVSKHDSDDYQVFIKKRSNLKDMLNESHKRFIQDLYKKNNKYYLDEDEGEASLSLTFRCVLNLK